MRANEGLVILLIVLVIAAVWLSVKLRSEKKQRKRLADENQKLIADNALLEVDHLKFQLQPHALRNILAQLNTIASNLSKGMNSLCGTLDYILYEGNSNLVSIKDEMDFVEKYLKLNDLFITEIDAVISDTTGISTTSKYYETPCIPHLITAHFIENAFKHGDINHPEFLKIKTTLTDQVFELNVVNKIRHQTSNAQGGIGLKNMRKRLDLLQAGNFEIKTNCEEDQYHSILTIEFSK
ncbi:MAG TPA: hypothetical protein EYN89_04655 [Flavobacteriales bacterium]|nr:hypothetical protein [Flavobacteriales bacterium]